MKDFIRKRIQESLKLKNWDEYLRLVADAYTNAPNYDASVVKHWHALNKSNYTLFQRLLSKVNVIFTTSDESKVGTININGKPYKVIHQEGDPYPDQSSMKADVDKNNTLKISIDYSDHPVFSVEDNVVFRTVHDYIVHILGNKPFGGQGEIASYNLHAKLVPRDAIPAIFTEVVGQASVAVTTGSFPVQKIAILKGFDFTNVGEVDDYLVKDKQLQPKAAE